MPMFASGANVNITGGNPIFNESTGDINIHQNFGGDHSTTYNYDSFNVRDNTWETKNTNKTTNYGNEDEVPPKRPQPQRNPQTEPNRKSQPHPAMYDHRAAASYPGPNISPFANPAMSNVFPPPTPNYDGEYPSQGRAPMPQYPPQMGGYPYTGQPTGHYQSPYQSPYTPQQASYSPHGSYSAYQPTPPSSHGAPPEDGFARTSGQGPQQRRRQTRPAEQESYDRSGEDVEMSGSSGEEEGKRDTRTAGKRKKGKPRFKEGDRNLSSRMGDMTLESKKASGSRMRDGESFSATTVTDRQGAKPMNAGLKGFSTSQKSAFQTEDEADDSS